MKPVYSIIAIGVAAVCIRANAAGPGHPGIIDRPTPPACCADGLCHPNPVTWGAYPTRWRRWPTAALAPTPAGVAPVEPDQALPAFEAPPKEEEDRRAPPPTQPVDEQPTDAEGEPGTTPPATEVPLTTPVTPPGGGVNPPGGLAPPGGGLMPPGERVLDLPDTFPFEDDPPETPAEPETNGGLPFGDDQTRDSDPPPRPPFSMPAVAKGPSMRPAAQPKPAAARSRVQQPLPSSNDDPPPALPTTLAAF